MRTTRREVRLDIAGQVLAVTGLVGAALAWVHERYRPFLSTRPASVKVSVDPSGRLPRAAAPPPSVEVKDGRFRVAVGGCRAEGSLRTRRVRLTVPPTPSALSPSLLRLVCSLLILEKGGFLLHASAVVEQGRAWVFCGPSESGKTTIATLAGARPVLNDETVALLRRPRGYAACATPFFGEGGSAMALRNTEAPVAAFFFLGRKARGFSHRRLSPVVAAQRALPQVFLPRRDPALVDPLLGSVADAMGRVPCYELGFAPSEALWEYVRAIA